MKKTTISDWEYFEKLVAFIEKKISPDSKVEHDVNINDLTKDSNKRQCDVIIRTGEPPRETTTLVEVQNRSRGFNITFFDGLIEKMRKVGAQHLIVVSRKKFPESIINESKRLGNTIRLVYFDENAFLDSELPRFTDNSIIVTSKNILKIHNVSIGVKKGELSKINRSKDMNTQEKFFFIENDFISINEIVNIYCHADVNYDSYQVEFSFDSDSIDKEIYIIDSITKEKFIIHLKLSASVQIQNIKLPINYISYSQVGYDDSLAVVMYANGIWNGEETHVTSVMKKRNDGFHMSIYDTSENLKNSKINIIEL